jgi:hypothetical protein
MYHTHCENAGLNRNTAEPITDKINSRFMGFLIKFHYQVTQHRNSSSIQYT